MRAGPLAGAALLACASLPAAAEDAGTCQPADLASLDGWNGIWLAEGMTSGLNGRMLPGAQDFGVYMKTVGLDAPWNEEGRRRFAAMTGGQIGREQHGWGFPVVMAAPTPFELIVGREKTAMVGEYRDIRVIYTDGRARDEDAWPTIYGESLGCWRGDTLEVETRWVHFTPEYNAFAPPLSDDAVFTEKLRLTGPDTLELDFTVVDPETLTGPWHATVKYFRHRVLDRLVIEGSLEQNNRIAVVDGQFTIVGAEGGLAENGIPAAPDGSAGLAGPPPVELTAEQIDRVAGDYRVKEEDIVLTFARLEGAMNVKADPVQPFFTPINAVSEFEYRSGLARFTFTTDAEGRVTGFSGTNPSGAPITGVRIDP